MNKTEAALDFIRRKGTARSDEIAAGCGLNPAGVSALLWPAVERGLLVACKVERHRKAPINEYRIAVGAGGRTPDFKPLTRTAAQARAEGRALAKIAKTETTFGVEPPGAAIAQLARRVAAPASNAGLLPIEKGVPVPSGMPRNVIRDTLLAMTAGDSIVIKKSSVATVYARAKDLGVRIRVLKSADGREARVWSSSMCS